eukprot:symbB.v1.2.016548.t1/scaffold1258.1/size128315/2
MAKTKGKVVEAAKQLQQLAAAEPTAKPAAKPKVDPPLTRVNGKTKSGEASGSRDGQVPASPTFDITWANFDKVKSHFGLSDKETTDVLLKVVGPDSSGSSFWVKYQQRVKEEILEQQLAANKTLAPEVSTEDAAPPKRRRVWPLKDAEAEAVLPENQLGDPSIVEGTEFANRAFYDVEMDDDMEGEEEEADDPDPIDDGVEVPATTGRDDDPDSPSPGAVAVADAAATVVCEAPPPGRFEGWCACSQRHLSRQASTLDLAAGVKAHPETDTEVGPSASEVAAGGDPEHEEALMGLVKSLSQEKQDLLKAFVSNSENLDNIEMQLVVARTSEGEVEHQRALLTIREMKEKGFRTFSERERTSVSGQASASIAASSDALGALMSDPLSAPSSSTGTCGNGPALRSLVDVASAPIAAEGAPKAKAKAKTKAKAKAGAQQVVPKTPEEQRAAIRI